MVNSRSDSVESDFPADGPRRTESRGGEVAGIEVGERLRRLRQVYGMSQRELARASGITNGAISMIEQDRVSPSVASLKRILDAFGLSLADFFGDDFQLESQVFYRAAEMTRIADGLLFLRQVGGRSSRRRLQVLHEVYAPGGDTGPTMLSHEGEEAGVVVRGEVEVTVGGQREVLGPGDGYYFNSRLPHRFRNVGQTDCELISSCTPPTF